jgi:K+-sensing histidine kinase KdpD
VRWRQAIHENPGLVRTGAVVLPLVACAVMSVWRDDIASATAVLVLAALIVAAASTGDRVSGVAAALSSGAWFDFFLTEPYQRFTIDDPQDVEATVLLVLIGLAVSEIALWGEREQARASRRSGYLDGVLGVAELVLARQDSAAKLTDRVAEQITEVLGVAQTRFVPGRVHDARFAVLHHDGTVTRGGHRVDVDRHGLPSDEQTALLVRRDQSTLGHFLITSAADVARPSLEQRRVAVLLADQLASLPDRSRG